MTTAVEKPSARQADAEDEFEIVLPEGADLDEPKADADAEVDAAEAGGKKPAEVAKLAEAAKPVETPAAEPKKTEKPEGLSPAAREERAKRKEYARKWEQVTAERDAALAQLNARRSQPRVPQASKEYTDNLIKRANEAATMGEVLQISLEEQAKRDAIFAKHVSEIEFNSRITISELRAKIRRPDYDQRLREAGIFEALQQDATGNFKDFAVAQRVYLSADPGEEAYQLAIGRLVAEGKLTDEEVEEARPKAPEAEETIVDKKPATVDAAAERREGAREVIDTVVRNSQKPRGIGAVKPAGVPKGRITFDELDRLSETDPARLEQIFKANPGLEQRWLGGGAS